MADKFKDIHDLLDRYLANIDLFDGSWHVSENAELRELPPINNVRRRELTGKRTVIITLEWTEPKK